MKVQQLESLFDGVEKSKPLTLQVNPNLLSLVTQNDELLEEIYQMNLANSHKWKSEAEVSHEVIRARLAYG